MKRGPTELICLSGELWVTIAGDPEDHILGAGDSVLLHRRARVVMLALRAARARIAIGAPRWSRAAP